MTPAESLHLAIRYTSEASDETEAAAGDSNPYFRSARRQALKEKLQAARELLAYLEREHPDATAPHTFDDGMEVTMTVPLARVWLYRTEAGVMMSCYEDWTAARALMERSLAIKADNPRDHVVMASICAQQSDFPAAIAAIERAIALDPDDFDFKRGLDELRREQERRAAAARDPFKLPFSLWRPSSWFG